LKRALLLIGLMLWASGAGAQAPAAPMTKWDKDHSLAKPHRIGALTVFSGAIRPAPADSEGGPTTVLTVVDAAGGRGRLESEVAFGDDVYASYGVGRFDPASSEPQLLLTTYTGGAHCCVHIQLLDRLGGKWRRVDVGTFDGSPFGALPRDVDGDGALDIVHWDDRFAYAFDSYAGSWMPPRVFNIRNGKVVEVSAEPRFRSLFVKDYAGAEKLCREGSNGACAGLVADGARIGRLDEAWKIALAHIDTKADWVFPGCKVAVKSDCPKDQQFKPADFRAALTQFLAKAGYTAGPQG
jgi:hypothetical protein